MAKKKSAKLVLTPEEKELFNGYLLERRSPSFDLEALKNQKRHAEQMLSISRPKLYEAYLSGKQGIESKDAARAIKVAAFTIYSRRSLAAQWLLRALGGFKKR